MDTETHPLYGGWFYDRNESRLFEATKYSHVESIKKLLAAPNVDLEKADVRGWTPLCKAVETGNFACFKLLIEHKANPHVITTNGSSLLHIAAANAKTDIIDILLKLSPNLEHRDIYRDTPLTNAVISHNITLFKLLLKAGAEKKHLTNKYPVPQNMRDSVVKQSITIFIGVLRKRKKRLASKDMINLIAQFIWTTRKKREWL